MKKILLMFIALSLVGCATGYKKSGLKGGYKDTQIQDDVFRVSFKGNAFIDQQKASDYALLRCAEVTLEKGFNYFVVLDSSSESKAYTYTDSGSSTTSGTIDDYGNVNATTTHHGGGTSTFYKPRSEMMIKTFKTKPTNRDILVFDAVTVRDNLKKQYKIKN